MNKKEIKGLLAITPLSLVQELCIARYDKKELQKIFEVCYEIADDIPDGIESIDKNLRRNKV